MFRITGLDGQQYYAKNIVELQQWVNEGRITPQMMIEDMTLARTTPAGQVPGLHWGPPQQFQPQGQQYQPPSTPFRSGPINQQAPMPGVDPNNVPRVPQQMGPTNYPRYGGGGAEVQAPMTKAIIATVLGLCGCCVPIGIVSIVFAAQVGTHNRTGNYLAAQQAANNANTWANIGIAVAVVALIFNVLLGGFSALFGG